MLIQRLFITLGLAVVLVAVVLAGIWWVARDEAETGIAQLRQQAEARGVVLREEGIHYGGFPLAFDLDVRNASVTWPQGQWIGPESVGAAFSVGDPQTIELRGPGKHSLRLEDQTLDVAMEEATLLLGLDGIDPASLRLEIETASLRNPALEEGVAVGALRFDMRPLPPLRDTSVSSRIDLDLRDVVLPEGSQRLTELLGGGVERLAAVADITGPLGQGPLPAVLRAWQAGGGRVEVKRILIEAGELVLDGSGTLSLDPQGRLSGEMTWLARGLPDLIQRMGAAGALPSAQAGTLRTLVTSMQQDRAGETGKWVTLPIQAKDGVLSLRLPFYSQQIAKLFPLF